MTFKSVKIWSRDEPCPEPDFPAFKRALVNASYHYADDSGGEWGSAGECMREAARIAVEAAWPYWAIKRMYEEAKPLPGFDDFMKYYCVALRSWSPKE
jgi:hypothetical protein